MTTDPTSYAAGIEAAALNRVRKTGKHPNPLSICILSQEECIAITRALAPERGGGSGEGVPTHDSVGNPLPTPSEWGFGRSPAPPAASGWRESLRPHIMGALKLELHDHQKAHALTEAVMRNLAAAPPSPLPAESGEEWELKATLGRIAEELGTDDTFLDLRVRQLVLRIRELEGDLVAFREERNAWRDECRAAKEQRDRLTRAAETARDALEPFASASRIIEWTERATGRSFDSGEPFQSGLAWRKADGSTGTITYGAFHRAREALATLSAALPREGGKDITGGVAG